MVEQSYSLQAKPGAGRIDWIEAFRGIASLGVVLWHTSNYIAPYGDGIAGRITWPASIFGVDLFFIVSGFVMVLATTRGPSSPSPINFFVRRVIRITPLYAFATLAFVALNPSSSPSWQHLLRSLLFLPGMESAGAPVYRFPIMSVGWTLNYEMYFYLVFAISLVFGRWRWAALLSWIAATVLVIPMIFGADTLQLYASENHFPFASVWLNLPTNPIILLFAAGVVCGLLHARGYKIGDKRLSMIVRSAAVALLVLQYACSFRISHSLLGTGLSLLPLVVAFTITVPVRFPLLPALRYLGAISYALYVAHPVVILALRLPLHQGITGIGAMFMVVLVSLLVAALAHHLVEQPIARWLGRGLRLTRRQPALA
jgi:peptidoglycan/LPS O-acetylase OafA/YrhL